MGLWNLIQQCQINEQHNQIGSIEGKFGHSEAERKRLAGFIWELMRRTQSLEERVAYLEAELKKIQQV